MQSLLPEKNKRDTLVVAVAPDSVEDIVKMIPKVESQTGRDFAITLVSDAEHKVIDRYGLLNEKAAERRRYLPHPTTYVIDKSGKVRWKFTEVNYKIRPTNKMILDALSEID